MATYPFGAWSINGDLYARGLGQMLRTVRLHDPDYGLSRDPEIYERLRRDPVVSFAIRLRKLLASGTDWYLEAASPHENDRLVLKIMEEIVKRISDFTIARFNLAEAIIAGSRWAHIECHEETIDVAQTGPMKWHIPSSLVDVDKRRMRQITSKNETTTRKVSYMDGNGNLIDADVPFIKKEWSWQIWRPLNQQWESIDRDEYVRHTSDQREDTLGFGGPLASEIYHYWYAKEVVLQYGLQYLERWAQGLVIAHVDTLRDGMASTPSVDRMNEWLNVLKKMRSEHALVADAKDRLEVIDAPTGGWTAAMQALEYLDGSIRVCVLGASLPTEKNVKGGSYAMADVQQGVSDLLGRFDRANLDESLRRDLLGWIWRKNYHNFAALGLLNCTLPYFRIREDRREDHEIRANVLLKARQAGMEIRRDEAYAQLGFSPPARGDEILPTLAEAESTRQAGQPKGEASGSGVPMHTPDEIAAANPGRPFEEKGNPNKPREQGADAKARGFSVDLDRLAERMLRFETERAQPSINITVPQQPAPVVNVTVPQQKAPIVNIAPAQVSVNPEINVAAAKAPIVNVAAAKSPVVHVESPTVSFNPVMPVPTVNVRAPDVKVDVAAPNVTITPAPKHITVERDARGNIVGAEVKPKE